MTPVSFRKIAFLSASALIIFSLSTCRKFRDYVSYHGQPKFTVYTNSADSRLANLTTTKKESITWYGTRGVKNAPPTLTNVIIIKKTDTSLFTFNAEHRIIEMTSSKGASFSFNWQSVSKAVLTIKVPGHHVQVNTLIDFAQPPKTSKVLSPAKKRSNTPLKVNYRPVSRPSTSSLAAASGSLLVSVQQCDAPSFGQVYVDVRGLTTGKNFGRFPGYPTSTGVYNVSLPTNNDPTLDGAQICEGVVDVLDYACVFTEVPGFQTLCPWLTAALVLATDGITAPASEIIFGSCEAMIAAMEFACATVGAEVGPGGPSVAETVCEKAEFVNGTFTERVRLTPLVIGLPDNNYGLSQTAEANGPFPNLTVNLGSNTAIRTLTLDPPAPTAQQSYVGKANVFCLIAGSVVTFSIVGTDGYTNSISTTITTTASEGNFELFVPGAATAGITDKVTIKITKPDGSVTEQVASLIFQ